MFQSYGIIPAIITPVNDHEELNEAAPRRLVNFLIQGEVHGLFATGNQGEFWTFSAEGKRRIWEVVKEESAG